MQRLPFRQFLSAALLLGLAPAPLSARDKALAWHYIDPASVQLRTLIPDPPREGSTAARDEIQNLLQRQQERTPAAIARAQSEAGLTPNAFAGVIGPWFNAENLPFTDQLLHRAAEDAEIISNQGKKLWARRRPPLVSAEIHPAIDLPATNSYPSGHAMRGTLWALILSAIAPDLADKLTERGKQIGDDRLVAGVHFPSDVSSGAFLGHVLFTKMQANPAFQADLARAKEEISRVRSEKAHVNASGASTVNRLAVRFCFLAP